MNFGSSIRVNKTGVGILGAVFIIILIYRHHSSSVTDEVKTVDDEKNISLKELLSASIDAAKRGGNEVCI